MSDFDKKQPSILDMLTKHAPEIMEKRGDRYYATEAGAIRLQELLEEQGIECLVSVKDGRFEIA